MKTKTISTREYDVVGQDNENGLTAFFNTHFRGSEVRGNETILTLTLRIERQEGKNADKTMKDLCLGSYPNAKWNDGGDDYGAIITELRVGVHPENHTALAQVLDVQGIATELGALILEQFPTVSFDYGDFTTFAQYLCYKVDGYVPGVEYDYAKVPYHFRKGFGKIAAPEEKEACAKAIINGVGVIKTEGVKAKKSTKTTPKMDDLDTGLEGDGTISDAELGLPTSSEESKPKKGKAKVKKSDTDIAKETGNLLIEEGKAAGVEVESVTFVGGDGSQVTVKPEKKAKSKKNALKAPKETPAASL